MPIWFIAWMIAIFGYLMHETDWLRVNLNATPESPPPVSRNEIADLCQDFGFKDWLGVLCGWEWAIEHKDLQPVYSFELSTGTATQKITNARPDAVAKVMKIYRQPVRPKREVYPPSHYAGQKIWKSVIMRPIKHSHNKV